MKRATITLPAPIRRILTAGGCLMFAMVTYGGVIAVHHHAVTITTP